VPDWAKIPFVPHGMPPANEFTIGGAKSIAKHEWFLQFGLAIPSDEAVKAFVFDFHWRWRGDHGHRYAILARWAYEFADAANKEVKIRKRQQKERPDIIFSPHLGDEYREEPASEADFDAELSPPAKYDRPPPGPIKRFILLNPPRSKGRSGGKPSKR
jgi:hypothetical protein